MACPGQPITFDASASSDWDGKLESYQWDFGDGTSAEGVAVEHVFDQPGVYRVRLRVTDDSGSACAAASDVVRVVVNNPPVADAGGDQERFRRRRPRSAAVRRVGVAGRRRPAAQLPLGLR